MTGGPMIKTDGSIYMLLVDDGIMTSVIDAPAGG
jgi:hypothetical protein